MVFNEFCSYCGDTEASGYQLSDQVFMCNFCLMEKLRGKYTKTCYDCRKKINDHIEFSYEGSCLCSTCITRLYNDDLNSLLDEYAPHCSNCKNHTSHWGAFHYKGKRLCLSCLMDNEDVFNTLTRELDPMELTLSF